MAADPDTELRYPVRGVDLANECDRQPADTTAYARNVRSWDPLAARERGGSRPGLVKHVSGRPGD